MSACPDGYQDEAISLYNPVSTRLCVAATTEQGKLNLTVNYY
jgi:hypothetical protein